MGPDGLQGLGGFDGLGQQLFDAGFTQALAKAGQRGGITGQTGLKVHLAAEVLPVGILQPSRTDLFVGEVVGVLEVQQADDQAHGQCRATCPGRFWRQHTAQPLGDVFPGHLLGQLHQGMLTPNHLIQAGSEEIVAASLDAVGGGRLVAHQQASKFC